MADFGEILGSMQDEIHKGRFRVEKLKDTSELFKGCKNDFEVYCKCIEVGDEQNVTESLSSALRAFKPESTQLDAWVGKLIQTIKTKNKTEFDNVFKRATAAIMMEQS